MPLFKKSKSEAGQGAATMEGPEVSILDIQKAFDARQGHRQAEHLRIIYKLDETTAEVRASITWEALAQLRQEMERAGKTISERGVLDFVLVPWIMDQLKRSHSELEPPPDDGYHLDFGAAPKPTEVRETLKRYGLLPAA